jgi:hypothetical protein
LGECFDAFPRDSNIQIALLPVRWTEQIRMRRGVIAESLLSGDTATALLWHVTNWTSGFS